MKKKKDFWDSLTGWFVFGVVIGICIVVGTRGSGHDDTSVGQKTEPIAQKEKSEDKQETSWLASMSGWTKGWFDFDQPPLAPTQQPVAITDISLDIFPRKEKDAEVYIDVPAVGTVKLTGAQWNQATNQEGFKRFVATWGSTIIEECRKYPTCIDWRLPAAMFWVESGGATCSTSVDNARGLTQMIPSTQALVGVTDPCDPEQSLTGGMKYAFLFANKGHYKDPVLLPLGYHSGSEAIAPFLKTRYAYPKARRHIAKVHLSYIMAQRLYAS